MLANFQFDVGFRHPLVQVFFVSANVANWFLRNFLFCHFSPFYHFFELGLAGWSK